MADIFTQVNRFFNELKSPFLYLEAQVLLGLYLLHSSGAIGRYSLAEELLLPSSRVRKILEVFRNAGLVEGERGRRGANLTEESQNWVQDLFGKFKILNLAGNWDLGVLAVEHYNVLCSTPLELVCPDLDSITVRDTAIKIGASGATAFQVTLYPEQLPLVRFYGESVEQTKTLPPEVTNALARLSTKLETYFSGNVGEWIVVAGSARFDPRPKNLPFLQEGVMDPLRLARLAAIQSVYEMVMIN